jgi:hypothetical protein
MKRKRNIGPTFWPWLGWGLALVPLMMAACTSTQSAPPEPPALQPVTLDETIPLVAGHTVYVPVYSHIYMIGQEQTINLTATLSVRNTDPLHPVIVSAVDYYNSQGELVRNYLDQPVQLDALSSAEFVVAQADISGGIGASFLVEWVAQTTVSDPVIEAIMINTQGNQGLSFVSSGRVIDSISTNF